MTNPHQKKQLLPIFCVVLSLFLFLCITSCSTGPASKDSAKESLFYSWVELGPDSQAIARVILPPGECPKIQLDDRSEPMQLRTSRDADYKVSVCEAVIPKGIQKALVLSRELPIPKTNPQKILFVGDTGCRIVIKKDGKEIVQNCNSAEKWPFLKVSQMASQWKPDLVVHVGDYLYREAPCPARNTEECAQSPYGNQWATWEADFFSPARDLLQTAPWIFVRGNHELCSRAGPGWFRFLDPRAYSETCSDQTAPYWVKVGAQQMVVLDSAVAEDLRKDKKLIQDFTQQFATIEKFPIKKGWLVTHRPVWGILGIRDPSVKKEFPPINVTLQAAAKKHLHKNINLVVSGHIHLFEALGFTDSGPAQIVTGNGGTQLDRPKGLLAGSKVAGRTVGVGETVPGFGYLTFEQSPDQSWKVIENDMNGKKMLECEQNRFQLKCNK